MPRGEVNNLPDRDGLREAVAAARDEDFIALYRRTVGMVYAFAYNKVGSREEAEDITSQVFLAAMRHYERFEGRGRVENWLLQIARVTIADHWRKVYRIKTIPLDFFNEEEVEQPLNGARPERAAERAQAILDRLSDSYRTVLVCRFLKRMSIEETAAHMRTTIANAKVLQHRALGKAREIQDV